MKKYQTILADPPWPYKGAGPVGTSAKVKQVCASDNYDLMSIKSLKFLSVTKYIARNAHLYLWTTNSFMVEAHEIAVWWGFTPKTIITWVKVHKNDRTRPSMKTGHYYRSATEHCLFCVKGSLKLHGPAAPTAFLHRRLPHSVKPKKFHRMIESQSPGPYLELFARRPYLGWDIWGNEVECSVNIKTPFR